jgi:hypothetical protein
VGKRILEGYEAEEFDICGSNKLANIARSD